MFGLIFWRFASTLYYIFQLFCDLGLNSLDLPVLLLTWRRPQTLRQVINAIRPVAPTRIFVACDGPNPDRPGEAEKVAATRQVIEQEIDWPCQIERLFSDTNQGCRLGVSRAITWFFEQVDEGIILEDDCVPHLDFFFYCTTLLERYRDDMRVWCISGNNFEDGPWGGEHDYFFTKIPMVWGWATWKNRWNTYDESLAKWPTFKGEGHGISVFSDPEMKLYWFSIWDKLFRSSRPDTWDYQWVFCCISNGGLCILPRHNLVANIGFGNDATHTTGPSLVRGTNGLNRHSLLGPNFVLSDPRADRYIFDIYFGGKFRRFPFSMLRRPKSFALSLVRMFRSFFT